MLGQLIEILLPDRLRTRHVEHCQGYFQSPTTRPMGIGLSLAGRRRDGSEFPVEISLSPMPTSDGLLVTGVVRDVTEHRQVEEQVRALNETLARQIAELDAVNKELEAFSYSVSHDLRAPLPPETYAAVQLNDVVRDTLLLAERQVTRTGVSLRVEVEDSLLSIRRDANALEQVLPNLITNAGAAVESGGEITIATRRHPDRPGFVQLIVADSGCGIPPDILPRTFDPFFSTTPSGTGLGLSISHGIVREHGGTIDVESTPGQGTRFTITLPVVDQPA